MSNSVGAGGTCKQGTVLFLNVLFPFLLGRLCVCVAGGHTFVSRPLPTPVEFQKHSACVHLSLGLSVSKSAVSELVNSLGSRGGQLLSGH